jgi:hypothetical protein
MKIYKYMLLPFQQNRLHIGSSAKPIHVGADPSGELCLWALVDPRESLIRTFMVLPTGDEVDSDFPHIGSVTIGDYVWHVFETTSLYDYQSNPHTNSTPAPGR